MRRRHFLQTLAGGTALGGVVFSPRLRAAESALNPFAHQSLKITQVEPMMIKGARGYLAWNLVKVQTDAGLVGIGEGFA